MPAAAGSSRSNGVARRLASLRESLLAELWPIPTFWIIIAVAAGVFIPLLDAVVDDDLNPFFRQMLFGGGSDAARTVLSAIAGSLITATSLTFSLTVVALQLASSQASPRLLRLFASDRAVHATLSVFLGTFAFALTVLRTVDDSTEEADAFVPRIAITVASLLTLTSIITLTLFLAHLARQLRVETMMRDVNEETARSIALVASDATGADGANRNPERPADTTATLARTSGFIVRVDRDELVDVARRHGVVIAEEHAVGSSVIEGTPLAAWWSGPGDERPTDIETLDAEINKAYTFEYERTSSQDIGFGVRQIADIASKALSPGINDPTTAVHALSHLSALLCSIAELPDQSSGLTDSDDNLRVIRRTHDFYTLLEVALQQPRRYGASDPNVAARLFQLLREVGYRAPQAEQRRAVAEQLGRLVASVNAEQYDGTEREHFAELAAQTTRAIAGHWEQQPR